MAYGDVSFEGLYGEYVTFPSTMTLEFAADYVGKAVYVDVDGKVYLSGSGTPIVGKVILIEEDGKVNIQTGGFCKLPYLGVTTAAIGKQFMGSSESGEITVVNTGLTYSIHHGRGVIVAVETNYAWVRL